MTIARVWPTGVPTNGPIDHDKITQLDINVTKCADFVGGGSYTPSAWVAITTAFGFQVSAGAKFSVGYGGILDVTGGSSVASVTGASWGGVFEFVTGAL
jgi:hypothetical protein